MKICMLIDSMVRGGRERRLIELLKQLKSQPHLEVCLVLFSKRIEYQELYEMDIPIHILERKPAKDPRVFIRLYQLLKLEKPDLLHTWGWMSTVYAVPAARLLSIPLLNAAITDAPEKLGWLDKRYLRARLTFPFSDIIAGNSEAGLRAYQAPVSRSYCIYNGFDYGRLQQLEAPDIIRKKLGIADGKIVGMVAAFHDRKDYDTFIKVATDILDERNDVTFIAIGNGPQLYHYRKQIPAKHKGSLLMPGLMQEAESIINIFDIGILCSFSEGISNAIMEYMVLGKPVLATSAGGTRELIKEGVSGYLLPVGDWKAMSQKINELLDSPDLCTQLGQNGHDHIQQNFSSDQMFRKFMELYKRLAPNSITVLL